MLSHRTLRSFLFVPGTRTNLLSKALATGADAIILDLEDSVPPAQKKEARELVSIELARSPERLTFLRINHPRLGNLDTDLAALARHGATEKKTRCVGFPFRRAAFGRDGPGDHRASAPRTRRYQSGAVEVMSKVARSTLSVLEICAS